MISRWEDYFLKQKNEAYCEFWHNYLAVERDILFVLGMGFDPRMCLGLESILQKGGHGKRNCILIDFDEGEESPSRDLQMYANKNRAKLDKLMSEIGDIQTKSIKMETDDGRRIGSQNAAKIFTDYSDFEGYTDIVIDISSLPLSVFFPLIGSILSILDLLLKSATCKHIANLHVVVAEDIRIDRSITQSGLFDDASYLHGFTGDLDLMYKEEEPTVWIPILGEGQEKQIELIESLVSPREICPVLPSPSIDPRRGDKIMLEHRELITGRLPIEIGNIIYGSEQNPFELYRQIRQTIEHYRSALKSLGKSKFAISPLSSKLMSMGSFLVAYEEGLSNNESVGIAYVESKGYSMELNKGGRDPLQSCELFSLWIFGDCYDTKSQLSTRDEIV